MAQNPGSSGGSEKRRRITIPVPDDLSARLDAAVHGRAGETLTSLILRAIEFEIDRLEMERGSDGVARPFSPAPRPPPGRPRKDAAGPTAPTAAAAEAADSSEEVERLMHVLEHGEEDEEEPSPTEPAPRAKSRSAGKSS